MTTMKRLGMGLMAAMLSFGVPAGVLAQTTSDSTAASDQLKTQEKDQKAQAKAHSDQAKADKAQRKAMKAQRKAAKSNVDAGAAGTTTTTTTTTAPQ